MELARDAIVVKSECSILGISPEMLIDILAIRGSKSLHLQCAIGIYSELSCTSFWRFSEVSGRAANSAPFGRSK